MKFRRAFCDALPRALPNFFERVAVRSIGIFVAPECAQAAVSAADVRRIDVPVDVVVAEVAVALLANMIREPSNGQQIARFIERQAILSRKPLASEHFLRDSRQFWIANDWLRHGFRKFCLFSCCNPSRSGASRIQRRRTASHLASSLIAGTLQNRRISRPQKYLYRITRPASSKSRQDVRQ